MQRALGRIDLDPCADAPRSVPAQRHFTRKEDGLARPWAGRVYMNPPYGEGIGAWVEKLVAAHAAGEVPEAIALVPTRTETKWFQRFRDYAICFPRGRLRFGGGTAEAPFPSAAVYLGRDRAAFVRAFSDLGDI